MFTESVEKLYYDVINYIPDIIWDYIPKSIITRTLLIGSTTGIITWLIFKPKYKLPPGPWALPLIGNTLFLKTTNIAKEFSEYSKKYGEICTVYLGPQRCVVLNGIDSINEALLKKGAQTSDRLRFHSFDEMLYNGEDIVLGRYGTGWKLRRKVAARAIRLFMLNGNLNGKIEEAVSKTVSAMLKEKNAFDPKPYLLFTTINIIAVMCFGKAYEYNDPEYWKILNILNQNAELSDRFLIENVFPIITKFYKSKSWRQLESIFGDFMKYIRKYVEAHQARFEPGKITDFTDSVLQAQKDILEEGQDNMAEFKHEHVLLTIFDIFFAGNDTSRATLLSAMMYIIAIPGVQQKLQKEVDTVIGQDRYPTTEDREQLSYSDAVLHETMRLVPAVPLGVPHMTTCDTKLGGYDVPKGTAIFINHWGIQNDPDKWTDVDKFKPERFLDENGKMAQKPDNWLPFSAGRRVCLGEPLAKPELHLILASLFQKLEISLVADKDFSTKINMKGFVIAPEPFKISVKKRY